MHRDSIGETVLFQWIEKAREWLQDKATPGESQASHSDVEDEEQIPEENWTDFKYQKETSTNVSSGLNIIHGDPISFKKSTFQGHVATIISTDQVKWVTSSLHYLYQNFLLALLTKLSFKIINRQVLSELMENKKIAHATHNMHAYRIYRDDAKSFSQDCNDDGETQAGGRLLHLLQVSNIVLKEVSSLFIWF